MPRITTALNIYLTPEQISGLDGAAKEQGISRAELVRRIVDEYLSARSTIGRGEVKK